MFKENREKSPEKITPNLETTIANLPEAALKGVKNVFITIRNSVEKGI
jgi:hypothetical protein